MTFSLTPADRGRDNAAMSERFQFSMARLFVAVTAFCVAACLFTIALRPGINETLALIVVGIAGAAICAGIGTLFRSVVMGVVVGVPLAFAVWFFLPSPLP
jgi:hypothetical protein